MSLRRITTDEIVAMVIAAGGMRCPICLAPMPEHADECPVLRVPVDAPVEAKET